MAVVRTNAVHNPIVERVENRKQYRDVRSRPTTYYEESLISRNPKQSRKKMLEKFSNSTDKKTLFLPKINDAKLSHINYGVQRASQAKLRLPNHFKKSPSYSISGRGNAMGHGSYSQDLASTPGPAAYNITKDFRTGPSFSFKGRTHLPQNEAVTPGPGSHNVVYDSDLPTYKSGPTFGRRYSHKVCTLSDRDMAEYYLGHQSLKPRSYDRYGSVLSSYSSGGNQMYKSGQKGFSNLTRRQNTIRLPPVNRLRNSKEYWQGYHDTLYSRSNHSAY